MDQEIYQHGKSSRSGGEHPARNALCREEQSKGKSPEKHHHHRRREAQPHPPGTNHDNDLVLLDATREHVALQDPARNDSGKRSNHAGNRQHAQLRRQRAGMGGD